MADGLGGYLFTIRDGASNWIASETMNGHLQAFMSEGWTGVSTRSNRALAYAHPGFITDLDVYTSEELEREPIYRDFFRPRGIGWAVATLIQLPSRDILSLNVERRLERGPVERSIVDQFDALRPHLARTAMISARLGFEQARARTDTLAALGLGAAAISRSGAIIVANDMFETYVPSLLRDRRDRVHAVDPQADSLLGAAIAHLGSDRASSTPLSIPIAATWLTPAALLHLVAVRGASRDLFASASAVLVVMPAGLAGTPAARLLEGLFDLTPAQARVARAVAEGLTVEQVAERLGITRETTRGHLKNVFAKTGTSRQGALVALIRGVSLPGTGETAK